MAAELVTWRETQEIERRLTEPIIRYGLDRWGWRLVTDALVLFSTCRDPGTLPMALPIFERWLAFGWVARPGDDDEEVPVTWPADSLGVTWLAAGPSAVNDRDRMFILKAAESPFSALLVEDLWPGWSLAVRDLLTGRRFRVVDPDVSAHARVDDILFSAVLAFDGIHVLLGAAPFTLPSDSRIELLENPIHYCERPWMTRAELTELDLACEVCNEYLQALQRGPAALLETGGDIREPLHLRWTVSIPFEEMIERLRPLSDCFGDEDAIERRNGPDGDRHALMTWCREGSSGEEDDCEMIGELYLDEERLSADVPTRTLANRLIAEIGSRLGPAATLIESRTALPVRVHTRGGCLSIPQS